MKLVVEAEAACAAVPRVKGHYCVFLAPLAPPLSPQSFVLASARYSIVPAVISSHSLALRLLKSSVCSVQIKPMFCFYITSTLLKSVTFKAECSVSTIRSSESQNEGAPYLSLGEVFVFFFFGFIPVFVYCLDTKTVLFKLK